MVFGQKFIQNVVQEHLEGLGLGAPFSLKRSREKYLYSAVVRSVFLQEFLGSRPMLGESNHIPRESAAQGFEHKF